MVPTFPITSELQNCGTDLLHLSIFCSKSFDFYEKKCKYQFSLLSIKINDETIQLFHPSATQNIVYPVLQKDDFQHSRGCNLKNFFLPCFLSLFLHVFMARAFYLFYILRSTNDDMRCSFHEAFALSQMVNCILLNISTSYPKSSI